MQSKKPALGMMIIERSRPMSAPPKYGARPETSEDNHEQEPPEQEKQYHQGGGGVAPTPESVGYRSSAETCGGCEYMNGSECAFLKIPVSAGDSCARFESKGEDARQGIAEHDAGGQSFEMEGEE